MSGGMEDTTRFSITWMCNGCGEFGVLLRPPDALFQEVLADSKRRHHVVSPACTSALMLDSEVAILPAPPDRPDLITRFLSRWEVLIGAAILIAAAWAVQFWLYVKP